MKPLRAITEYRENQDPPMSREQLGKLLSVNRATVFRWEDGTRRPNRTQVLKLMKVTGLPARDLRPDLAAVFGAAE